MEVLRTRAEGDSAAVLRRGWPRGQGFSAFVATLARLWASKRASALRESEGSMAVTRR